MIAVPDSFFFFFIAFALYADAANISPGVSITDKIQGYTDMKFKRNSSIFKIIVTLIIIFAFISLVYIIFTENKKSEDFYPEITPTVSLTQTSDLPEIFPTDFPRYENAEIVSSWQTQSQERSGLSILLETSDNISIVSAFYKESLVENGWEINIINEDQNSVIISFSKDKYSGPLGITKSDSGTTLVSVTIGIEK